MSAKSRILVLNGPNLNLLGLREPTHYGHSTLAQVVDTLTEQAHNAGGVELEHLQSNREYELIEAIHSAYGKIDFIIINPAAFTHTSVALRDALLGVASHLLRCTYQMCMHVNHSVITLICQIKQRV